MTKILSVILSSAIIFTSCTKQISAPDSSDSGPQLTFKSHSILTIGDSIKNVTAYPPFIYAITAYINYLNTAIVPMQVNVEWKTNSETGQPLQMGAVAQLSNSMSTFMQINHRYQCTMLQYQNQEADHYTDGSIREILVGEQYYAIVSVQ